MKKTWNILKKILLWGSLVFLFLVTAITIFLKIYEKDIKQYAVEEINKYLTASIDVQDIEIAFISSFPYASLDFQKVIIKDNYQTIVSNDTLFYAENLYLSFSVLDIYNEDYKVKNIEVEQAVLKLKTAQNGEINYNITKPVEDTASSNFEFAVELFKLQNLDFEYSNMATKQFYIFNVKNGEINGKFNHQEYILSSEAELFINQIKTNSFSIISNKNAELDLALNIDSKAKTYHFSKGDLTIEQMPFKIQGKIKNDFINLSVDGDQIDLDNLSKSILNNSVEVAKTYKGQGLVSFKSKIIGPIEKTTMPSITASFSIEDGQVTHLDKNLTITRINVNGQYKNSQHDRSESLVFDRLKMNLLGSYIEGSTQLVDFAVPTFKGEIAGEVDLQNIHAFFQLPSIKTLTGKVQFNTVYAIKFEDIQYNPQIFDISETIGRFSLKEVAYQGQDDNVLYQNINGEVIVNGDDAAAKNISVRTQNSDLLLNGALKDFIPFIEGNSPLGLIATLESDYILLNDFLGDNKQNANNNAHQSTFEMSDAISLNLDLKVKTLDWDNHKFTSIDGKLLLTDRVLKIPHFELKTLKGDIAGNLVLENYLVKGNSIKGKFRFNGIDVTQLFEEWDNFDQATILSSNIRGNAKGQINMTLLFDQYFNILMDKIWVDNKIVLSDGALVNLPLMKDITDYMRSNKALKIALNKHIDNFDNKLKIIQFQTLQNDILIENGKISIPKMDIKSNAMDITLAGWHDFKNEIDYHFSFRFRELKTIPEYTEFGKVEDDGLGWKIYLSMSGNIEDPLYSLDKDSRNATIAKNVAEEKATVKSILKSELGLFHKDSTVKHMQSNEKSNAVEFIMYDENQDVENLNPKTESKKVNSTNKKKTNRFFEKLKAAEDKEKAKKEAATMQIDQ